MNRRASGGPVRPIRRPAPRWLAAAAAASVLGGCVVGPDYAGPPPSASAAEAGFRRAKGPVTAAAPAVRWWDGLGDPVLADLVDEALTSNPNVRIAWARLRQARAVVGGRVSELGPTVSAAAAGLNNQVPVRDGFGEGFNRALGGQSVSRAAIPKSLNFDLYNATFDASWEIDIFGGRHRAVEQAEADADATGAALADAHVQVAAETAQAYVALRGAQRRLALTQRAAALQRESLRLGEQRLGGGASSALDVERLRTQFETTASQAPALQAEVEAGLNRLAVLVALEPGVLDGRLRAAGAVPRPPRTVEIGDPGGLLRHRPDVRRAERQLAAANARIGQAVAQLFPRGTLLGNAGWVSPNIGSIGTLAASTYSVGPTLSWNILDFGRTLSQIRQAEAGTDAALAEYERAVLGALEDAETALSRYGHQRSTVWRLARASAAANRASKLTNERNLAGTISVIDVLDVERQRLQAEQASAQAEMELTTAYVALQKALGLGWSSRGTVLAAAK